VRAATVLALAVTLAATGVARAETLAGRIYEAGPGLRALLYTWQLERDEADRRWRSWYRTPAGELAAADEVAWDGDTFASYRYTRHVTGEVARLERRDGDLLFHQVLGGRTREHREPADATVTVGPTVILYARRHWDLLQRGQQVTTRYAVLDQLRSFAFRLARVEDHPAAGPETAVVKMWPANPLLRLVVAPAYLLFSRDGQTFRGLIGRQLPVALRDGRFRAVEGELVLDVPARTHRAGGPR
jgi:hypothetical protein